MENARSCCSFLICTTLLSLVYGTVVNGNADNIVSSNHHNDRKLFVFGDSYADTGNLGKLGSFFTPSWYKPYGMTASPKRAIGRFSDGRVSTDFVAGLLGIKTPMPYKYRKLAKKPQPYGMNFAIGGSGVFDTMYVQKNLTVQISRLRDQFNEGLFTESDIKSSIGLVVVSGNDYATLRLDDPDYLKVDHITNFINKFMLQLSDDLKLLQSIGVSKVFITNMQPLSCTPTITRSNKYTICQSNITEVVTRHNIEFDKLVNSLNSQKQFLYPLDINTAINNIVHQVKGAPEFKYPMVPCCVGITESNSCGEEDDHGVKAYTLCKDPTQHFYWDMIHPTQAGWKAVFKYLEPEMKKSLN